MSRTRISVVLGALAAFALVACSSDEPSLSTGESTIVTGSADQSGATTTTGSPAAGDTTTTTGSTDGSTVASTVGSTEGSTVESATSTTTATATTIARVVDDPSDDVHGGDTGPGVEQIQFILKANGYDLPVDGQFGPVTELAVRDFQKKSGLKEDGIVGPITWSRLQASVGTTTSTTAAGDSSATSTTS